MTPLLLFLLGCVATYLGIVAAAFSSLMRLSLRIMAEGSGRGERLQTYWTIPDGCSSRLACSSASWWCWRRRSSRVSLASIRKAFPSWFCRWLASWSCAST